MNPKKELVIDSIKRLFTETLGMSRVAVKHNSTYESECYSLNGEFYRIDTFRESEDSNTRIYCIEWAENEQDARHNFFEDSWLYPDTMELSDMLSTIKKDILNG